MSVKTLKKKLTKKDRTLLLAFTKNCRGSILEMTAQAQSGHPGGSLSCIDLLSVLYTQIISKTGEKIVISNGHISPAVYAILAELSYVKKEDVIKTFRQYNSIFEGHVSREVPGVWFGTGPLGIGVSAATGFAHAEKLNKTNKQTFALIGDGESQEGQVYEMMHYAKKYALNNLIVFMDFNSVQLSGSLRSIMPYTPEKTFRAAGWNVLVTDGHDFQKIWKSIVSAHKEKNNPTIIIAKTIMGKGVSFMEKEGAKQKSTWHGKAPSEEQVKKALRQLSLSKNEEKNLDEFRKNIVWKPSKPNFKKLLSKNGVFTGIKKLYPAGKDVDCRSAYGNALLDLAKKNKDVIAVTADLADSVKTSLVRDAVPKQHLDCGVAEQQMVSMSGGMSLTNKTVFCSTFGAFMTSRAKDQMRVNDINQTNVKMVATHCGVSVGEDGPTHQAIDDAGSTLGLLNTMQVEPADANHCDRLVRFIASKYGNFYMRMGRHKLPILTKKDGSPFFDKKYIYSYGKCDVLRSGNDITIVAIGSTVAEAVEAHNILLEKNISSEIVIASSIKQFDETLFSSIKKTGSLLTVEDHTTHSGLGNQIVQELFKKNIVVKNIKMLGVDVYQMSGTQKELYRSAGIDASSIVKKVLAV